MKSCIKELRNAECDTFMEGTGKRTNLSIINPVWVERVTKRAVFLSKSVHYMALPVITDRQYIKLSTNCT
jgi:hypothetical protein